MNKFKNILKLFAIGTLFVLAGCEVEEPFAEKENQNHQHLKIIDKKVNQLFLMPKFRNYVNKSSSQSKVIRYEDEKSIIETQYGVTVSDENVKIIEANSKTTYTFYVTTRNQETGVFKNLVIEVDSLNNSKAAILKYTPSEPVVFGFSNQVSFKGTTQISPIQNTTNLDVEYGCDVVIAISKCNGNPYDCGGAECGFYYLDLGGGGTAGSGYGSGIGFGNSNSWSSSTSGGGAGSTGNTTTNSNGETPHGNYGSTSSSSSPTGPKVITTIVLPKPLDEKKCELFNKLKNDANFKQYINDLKTSTTLTNETGQALTRLPNGTYSSISGVPDPNVKHSLVFTIPNGTIVDIIMHSHDVGALSIFTPTDIKQMYNIFINNYDNVDSNQTFTSIVVTPNLDVYAMTITDRERFIAFYNDNFGTPDKEDIFKNLFILPDMEGAQLDCYDINPNNSVSTNENNFVKMLKNSGLKLHKANADLSQWNPLKLNNSGTVVPETPCN